MLIDFTVENFRSFKGEQTLSMLVANSMHDHVGNFVELENDADLSLLKTSLIYGANASGKSNLILALETLRDFVTKSTELKVGDKIPYYIPHRPDPKCAAIPTKLEIEFVSNDKIRYKYTIVYNKEEILLEELVFYPNRQEARLFLREKDKRMLFGSYFKGKKYSLADEVLDNNLFLSKAANSNHKQLKEIYLYFLRSIKFHTSTDLRNILPKHTTRKLLGKDNLTYRTKVINFLKAADTGIQAIDIMTQKLDDIDGQLVLPDDMPEALKKKVIEEFTSLPVTFHKVFEGETETGVCRFDLEEESNGTIKMYELAGKIIDVLENGDTFVIDELDSSFHPFMSDYILQLFNNTETNPNNAQLIVTTHDVTIMDPLMFRRDQIWFAEKNRYGATELYSLDEFEKNEVRRDVPFGRWYLSGRFGALPLIDKSVFNIQEN